MIPKHRSDLEIEHSWGRIFSNLGYGLAITQEHALVWRYSPEKDPGLASKSLKIKIPHPSVNSRQPLPLGLLVASSGEPALLIVTPTSGKVTYWESLSLAASSDSSRQKQQCMQGVITGMMSGEVITNIAEGEPHGFVLTMSSGRVAHMAVSDPQGKPSVIVQFMRNDVVQSGSLFGSLRSVFSSAGWKRDIAAVRPGVSLYRGQRQMVVATTTGAFQIWDLNWNGTQSLIAEIDGKEHFLKMLAEGGDIFHDHYDHHFEVLDFAFKPNEPNGAALTRTQSKGDCSLHVLTVLHGNEESKYNLMDLTVTNGSVTVDIVHPIWCYRTPLPANAGFKPHIIVPEPGRTAFVIFERTVVLVSLARITETPNSQLLLEANIYQDPFQDAIDFDKHKHYRSMACTAEAAESNDSPASCVVLVHGYGVIRILALSMPKAESATDRIRMTARTKIEQAVFYGNIPQNLLDFSGRPEITFDRDQIESAVKEISLSITKNASPYLPKEAPSLETQLQRQASALADLMKLLKQRYEPLSRPTRWQLLWDAEKLAAAAAMWRTNQIFKANFPNKKQYVLDEAIVNCVGEMKTENQPDRHETDAVRHWFRNDVWRIEKLLPYVEYTVDVLHKDFEEAPDADRHGPLTHGMHARWITESVDLQLVALETAFRFREANAVLYGIDKEPMVDGVLQRGFDELPEPWTSTVDITGRFDKQVHETLKLYGEYFGKEVEEEELDTLLEKIGSDLPGQIQVWNQTNVEMFRWLKSRKDQKTVDLGESYKKRYFEERRELFVGLFVTAGNGGAATQLAEKYADMAALVDIKANERLELLHQMQDPTASRAAFNKMLEQLEVQILSYFTKYGNQWADAYFKKHLDDKQAAGVLEQSGRYQQWLTQFLRRNPKYSKVRWINEVCAERDFLKAADSLQRAQQDDQNLWYQKIELSMRKLALLAANQQTQVTAEDAKDLVKTVDASTAIIKTQEDLYEYVGNTFKSAIDADAEADLVRETFFQNLVNSQPYLLHCAERNIKRLVGHQALDVEDLIDMLTLMNGEADQDGHVEDDGFIECRFFLALRILKRLGYEKSEPARHNLLEQIIWRRCMIQDSWAKINRTENKDDEQVEAEISDTAYFKTLRLAFEKGIRAPFPSINSIILFSISIAYLTLRSHTPKFSLP